MADPPRPRYLEPLEPDSDRDAEWKRAAEKSDQSCSVEQKRPEDETLEVSLKEVKSDRGEFCRGTASAQTFT